ncbi:MAG: DUF3095 domain-containing protein [Thiomicrospira sp.]|uniref:DUF3095 domain-containing protein n=1 Tax=Thiomicrospira sp. TaxID=935 RepID=UPI0019E5C087|nr:DUF3095 domain-containing protein [Thiomicrospira sp.]MBE0494510.1 DUF3095 domain-containing protein [Thiomicrospira sp.]
MNPTHQPASSERFFEELNVLTDFDEILHTQHFQALPDDWWIVVTDVVNSTQAIQAGQYRAINAVGGATVAAITNAVKPLHIPYVFGGDGASFCIPNSQLEAIKPALIGSAQLARDSFQLDLRIGCVPYVDIKPHAQILIARFQKNASLEQAVFIGGGLTVADRLIKQDSNYSLPINDLEQNADFSGFECRWNRIPSPKDVTLSLIVKPRQTDLSQQLALYAELKAKIRQTAGDEQQHHPINPQGMKLGFSQKTLMGELEVKGVHQTTWQKFKTLWKLRYENLIGLVFMTFSIQQGEAKWGNYKTDFMANSDYRKLDDMYRTVLTASEAQCQHLIDWLETQYQAGHLYYGTHKSNAAIVTCLINKTGVDHMHFVDGADGGYASAASALKTQISRGAIQPTY